jgi:hypothetical protein
MIPFRKFDAKDIPLNQEGYLSTKRRELVRIICTDRLIENRRYMVALVRPNSGVKTEDVRTYTHKGRHRVDRPCDQDLVLNDDPVIWELRHMLTVLRWKPYFAETDTQWHVANVAIGKPGKHTASDTYRYVIQSRATNQVLAYTSCPKDAARAVLDTAIELALRDTLNLRLSLTRVQLFRRVYASVKWPNARLFYNDQVARTLGNSLYISVGRMFESHLDELFGRLDLHLFGGIICSAAADYDIFDSKE